jgi:hypothetical protein
MAADLFCAQSRTNSGSNKHSVTSLGREEWGGGGVRLRAGSFCRQLCRPQQNPNKATALQLTDGRFIGNKFWEELTTPNFIGMADIWKISQ